MQVLLNMFWLLAVLAVVTASPRGNLETVFKGDVDIDFSALRGSAAASKAAPWHHSTDLLYAVNTGKTAFEVVESVKSTEGWDLTDYEAIKDKALYETKTSYTLAAQTVSLDRSHHASAVRELSATHFVHCPSADAASEFSAFSVGDHVIGSNHGAWFKTSPVQVAGEAAGLLARHADDASKHALVLARRVLAVEAHSEAGCAVVRTEAVHPLELFATVRNPNPNPNLNP